MHFYNYRILFQIKREYSQHTTRLICLLRPSGPLSMEESSAAPSPTQWKLKRENPSASYRGVLRPSTVRDAFGMRSGRKQRFVFTYEPNRSISNAVRQGMANWFFYA